MQMGNDKKQKVTIGQINSKDLYQSFLDTFKTENLGCIFEKLKINPKDKNDEMAISYRIKNPNPALESIMVPKHWELSCRLMSAYLQNNPNIPQGKDAVPSKLKEQCKRLVDNIDSFKSSLEKKIPILTENAEDIPNRLYATNLFLTLLRGAGRNKNEPQHHTNPLNEGNFPSAYHFDKRLANLIKELEWLKTTAESAQSSDAIAGLGLPQQNTGKGCNIYDWGFFISLCNVFYDFSGLEPVIGKSKGKESDAKLYLEKCYQGFGIDLEGSQNKFSYMMGKLKEGDYPKENVDESPNWL